jgi:hypothetical protein
MEWKSDHWRGMTTNRARLPRVDRVNRDLVDADVNVSEVIHLAVER